MKRLAVGPGVYRDQWGFQLRFSLDGKRKWKKLDATTKTAAFAEARAFQTKLAQAKSGLAPSPVVDKNNCFARAG